MGPKTLAPKGALQHSPQGLTQRGPCPKGGLAPKGVYRGY